MTEIEELIQKRLEVYNIEVLPLIEKENEELSGITVTPDKLKEYIYAIGQNTIQLDSELEEYILGMHSHYCGRMEGLQLVIKLFELMRAPKVSYIRDRGDTPYTDYKCGHCGMDVYEDAKFCSECGVALYFEESDKMAAERKNS